MEEEEYEGDGFEDEIDHDSVVIGHEVWGET